MTENEAINEFEQNIQLPFGGSISDETSKMAIKALEKQIPKKPRDNGLRSGIFNVTKYYSCPRCGNVCLTEMMNERQNTSYCWDCGQKLDWSDEE